MPTRSSANSANLGQVSTCVNSAKITRLFEWKLLFPNLTIPKPIKPFLSPLSRNKLRLKMHENAKKRNIQLVELYRVGTRPSWHLAEFANVVFSCFSSWHLAEFCCQRRFFHIFSSWHLAELAWISAELAPGRAWPSRNPAELGWVGGTRTNCVHYNIPSYTIFSKLFHVILSF